MVNLEKRQGKAALTFSDRFLAQTLLPLIPRVISPNQITVFRFILVPFIIYFLLIENYTTGTVLFILAALSDAIDGAIARTQHRITKWGKLYDPIADKLLIGSVAIILISRYISPVLTLAIVTIEALIVSAAYYKKKSKPEIVIAATVVGKIKMVLQCVGVIFLLFYLLFHIQFFLWSAALILCIGVLFGVLAFFSYNSI